MNGFIELSSSREIEAAITRAMSWEYPSLFIGDPGTGKTTALRHFVIKYDGFYCEVNEKTKSPGGLYKMLIQTMIGYRDGKTMWDDGAQLIYFLENHWSGRARRPLFVDEQQAFEAPALRELLHICERCQVPLVLAGNRERLAKTRKTDSVALEQIRSRIGWRVQLGKPNAADCESIGIEHNVEGKEAYAALASFGAGTNLRELVRLLQEAKVCTGGVGSIQLRHVKAAVLSIYGSRDALKLLSTDPSN